MVGDRAALLRRKDALQDARGLLIEAADDSVDEGLESYCASSSFSILPWMPASAAARAASAATAAAAAASSIGSMKGLETSMLKEPRRRPSLGLASKEARRPPTVAAVTVVQG